MIIYSKLNDLMQYANTLRAPHRDRFIELIKTVYLNISGMVYTNSLDDDEMIIYSMLMSRPLNIENKEKIMRCLAILIT